MCELRQNMVTRQWFVIAVDRARRPEEFTRPKSPRAARPHESECPFCPGNESHTPPEQFRIGSQEPWRVRVVPNRYSLFNGEGERNRKTEGLYQSMSGVGVHEVIIDTPRHDEHLAAMAPDHVADLVRTYRHRTRSAIADPRVELVLIFKNRLQNFRFPPFCGAK